MPFLIIIIKKRKEQIQISEKLKKNGINTIVPKTFNNKKFILLNKKYYLIFDYYHQKHKKFENLTEKDIIHLAHTQAKIHKLHIKTKIPSVYKKIKFNLKKHIESSKQYNIKLYEVLKLNYNKLNELISKCNNNIKNVKRNLCISHNDYKLLNILRDDNNPILLDFDALGLSNPTCSLCESAFTFSHNKNYINYDFYKIYLSEYIKEYGIIKDDFYSCLYVCLNGKIQWLIYMFSKNHLKNNNYIEETIKMINEFILYYNNIEKFYNIYCQLTNKHN